MIKFSDKCVAILNRKNTQYTNNNPEYLGTGFFWGCSYLIVTCAHTIEGVYSENDYVRLRFNGNFYEGILTFLSKNNDIALIESTNISNNTFFNKYLSIVDELTNIDAYTVGYDQRNDSYHQPTKGISASVICSGLKENVLQLDNANNILPGFSGAPLVDGNEYVIGIVSNIIQPTNGYHGNNIAYAIPVQTLCMLISSETKYSELNILSKSDNIYNQFLARSIKNYRHMFVLDGKYRNFDIDGSLFGDVLYNNHLTSPKHTDYSAISDILLDYHTSNALNNAIIIGKGGIGKSICLLNACNRLLKNNIVSLFIELVQLDWEIKQPLEKYINNQYSNISPFCFQDLKGILSPTKQLFIILDGFNEINDRSKRILNNEIRSLSDEHISFVISSRYDPRKKYGWNWNYDIIEILPFSNEFILGYLKNHGYHSIIPYNEDYSYLDSPLILTLFSETEQYYTHRTDIQIIRWHHTHRHSLSAVIWNYLQCQIIKHYENNSFSFENILNFIFIIEYATPYICFEILSEAAYSISSVHFQGIFKKMINYYSNLFTIAMPNRLASLELEFGVKFAFNPNILYSLLTNEIPFFIHNNYNDTYSITHEHFRNCLAAIFYVNEFDNLKHQTYSSVWIEQPLNTKTYQFLCDILPLQDIESFPVSWINDGISIVTRNIFELLRRIRKNDFSDYKFSNLHLEMVRLSELNFHSSSLSTTRCIFDTCYFTLPSFSLQGHQRGITCQVVASTKPELYLGSADNRVSVWNLNTGMFKKYYLGNVSRVTCIHQNETENLLLSGSFDGKILIWNEATDEVHCKNLPHTAAIKQILYYEYYGEYISIDTQNILCMWNNHTTDYTILLQYTDTTIVKALMPDYDIIGIICENGCYCIYHIDFEEKQLIPIKTTNLFFNNLSLYNTFNTLFWVDYTVVDKTILNKINTLEYPLLSLNIISVAPPCKKFAISIQNTIQVYTYSPDISLIDTVRTEEPPVCMTISPNGKFIAYSNDKYTAFIKKTATGDCISILHLINEHITNISFSGDEKLCFTGYINGLCIGWDFLSEHPKYIFHGQTGRIRSMVYSSKYNRCIFGSSDMTLRSLDMNKRKCIHAMQRHTDQIRSVALSFDQSKVISASNDLTICVWDVKSGKFLFDLLGHTDRINFVKCALTKNICISCSDDCTIRIWDLNTKSCINELKEHSKSVSRIAIMSEGTTFFSISEDGLCKYWRVSDRKSVNTSPHCKEPLSAIDIVKGTTSCLFGTKSGKMYMWNPVNQLFHKFHDIHSGMINRILYIDEIKSAFSCSADCKIVRWIFDEHFELKDYIVFAGHTGSINRMVFDHNTNHLISGGDDQICIIWNIETGFPIKLLYGHASDISSIVLDTTDSLYITGSADNSIRLWDTSNYQCVKSIPILTSPNVLGILFKNCYYENDTIQETIQSNGGIIV